MLAHSHSRRVVNVAIAVCIACGVLTPARRATAAPVGVLAPALEAEQAATHDATTALHAPAAAQTQACAPTAPFIPTALVSLTLGAATPAQVGASAGGVVVWHNVSGVTQSLRSVSAGSFVPNTLSPGATALWRVSSGAAAADLILDLPISVTLAPGQTATATLDRAGALIYSVRGDGQYGVGRVDAQAVPPAFSLRPGATCYEIGQGNLTAVDVNADATGGFSGDVALALLGAPPGLLTELAVPTATQSAGGKIVLGAGYAFAPGTYTLTVLGQAGALSATAPLVLQVLPKTYPTGAITLTRTSPLDGEQDVNVTRETVLNFSAPLSPSTVSSATVYAEFGGAKLPATVHLSPDQTQVTLFYSPTLPASARVRVTVDGAGLIGANGQAVDPDADSVMSDTASIAFDTLSLTTISGTQVCGRIFASELLTSSAVTSPSLNLPLPGVKISVDAAPALSTTTDLNGNFCLNPAPVGRFFVHMDGRTATAGLQPGTYYPYLGKAWESSAGQSVNVGDFYLPLIPTGTLQTVSAVSDTLIRLAPSVVEQFPDYAAVSLLVPADAAYSDAGPRGGKVGIAPVPPDRMPGSLPAWLRLPVVITVQTDEATNFDRPVGACFPNLPDPQTGVPLAPGAKSTLWSFNHDTGRFEPAGPMTASSDGKVVCTDAGVGIPAPGWHGTSPGSPAGDGGAGPAEPCIKQARALGSAQLQCGIGIVTMPIKSPAIGCALGAATSVFFEAVDCDIDPGSCGSTTAANVLGVIAGCIPGVSQAWTIFYTCLYGLGSAHHDYELCMAGAGPPPLATAMQYAIPQDIVSEQFALYDAYAGLFNAVMSDTVWMAVPPQELGIRHALITAVNDSLQPGSPGGAQITSGERAAISGLPRPSTITAANVDALVDRLNRANAGLLTAAEISTTQVLSALATLSETVQVLSSRGWQTTNDFFNRYLPDLSVDVGRAISEVTQSPLYFRARNLTTGIVQRGRLPQAGVIDRLILAPSSTYEITYVDPATFDMGTVAFTSAESGSVTRIPRAVLVPPSQLDSDSDGLPDLAEPIIGTDPGNADSDNDGVLDGAEIKAGTNPLDNRPAATGVIGSAGVPGYAIDVCARNDLAAVAAMTRGVSIFNVFGGLNPLLVAQVDTPGTARAVACGDGYVAVADSEAGLAIVDVRTPSAATLVHQVALDANANAVAVAGNVAYVGLANGKVVALDLGTGQILNELVLSASNAIQDVGVGSGGDVLYALRQGTLHAISLKTFAETGAASSPGSIGAGGRRLRLSVGEGVAYAAHTQGYNTISLTNPLTPSLITSWTSGQGGWKHMAPTGSGIGVAAVGNNSGDTGPHDIDLYDLTNTRVNSTYLTTLLTPGLAEAAAVYNGMAYVADGAAGLQVINFRAADTSGVPPTITLRVNIPGNLTEEGKLLRLSAWVTDNVQVRNVEFYVDGRRAGADGGYPFEYAFIAPLLSQQPTVTVQARATDTGGNTAWSASRTITLAADLTPPTVTRMSPVGGGKVVQNVFLYTSEPLSATTLTSRTLYLKATGADGALGTSDDITLTGAVTYRVDLGAAALTFSAPLTYGRYMAVLSSTVTDLSGNAFASVVTRALRVADGVFFANPAGGAWSTPANWNTGFVPGPNDTPYLDVPGATVTYGSGSSAVPNVFGTGMLSINGGTLSVSGTLQLDGGVRMAGGTLANATVLSGTDGVGLRGSFNASSGGIRNVTLAGNARLEEANSYLRMTGAITLANSTLLIGNGAGNNAYLYADGQTLITGTGALVFSASVSVVRAPQATDQLTLGPGVLARGAGSIEGSGTVTNFGTLRGDVNNANLTMQPSRFVNAGAIESVNNAGAWINATSWQNLGSLSTMSGFLQFNGAYTSDDIRNLSATNGRIYLAGSMDNAGRVLTLTQPAARWYLLSAAINGGAIAAADGQFLRAISPGGTLRGVELRANVAMTEGASYLYATQGLTLNNTIITVGGSNNASFYASGAMAITGTGEVYLGGNVDQLIANTASDQLTLGPGVLVRGNGSIVGSGTVTNFGTLRGDVNNASLTIQTSRFVNAGAIESVNNGGVWVNVASWQNLGALNTVSGFLQFSGSYTADDLLNLSATNGRIYLAGTMDNAGGAFTLTQPSAKWYLLGAVISNTILAATDGQFLRGTGNGGTLREVTLRTNVSMTEGTSSLALRQTVTLENVTIYGSSSSNNTVSALGQTVLTGTGQLVFYGNLTTLSVPGAGDGLTIGPGVAVRGNYLIANGAGTITSYGAIRSDQPYGSVTFQPARWSNFGAVEANSLSSNLTLGGIGYNPGILNILSNTVSAAGLLTQTAGSVTTITLAGASAFGAINSVNCAPLNYAMSGTLNLALQNGYSPGVGTSFRIVNLTCGGTRTGSFETVNGTDIGGGKMLQVEYWPLSVTLRVVSATLLAGAVPDGPVLPETAPPEPVEAAEPARDDGAAPTQGSSPITMTVRAAPLGRRVPSAPAKPLTDPTARIATEWMTLAYDAARQERLSPVAAARLFGYAGIAFREGLAQGASPSRSLAGILRDLPALPAPLPGLSYDWPVVAIAAESAALEGVLYGPQARTREAIAALRRTQLDERGKVVSPAVIDRSVAHGEAIGRAIAQWAAADKFLLVRGLAYTPANERESDWQPPSPGARPVEPLWGHVRPFVLADVGACDVPPDAEYSTDPASEFYAQAMEVKLTGDWLTEEEKEIADFWSDAAGLTGTPGGHWLLIAAQAVRDRDATGMEAADAFAATGIALHDAFVSAWSLKYRLNAIRPDTYIRRVIAPEWSPYLPTPSFPEYPSGHSVGSGAAERVLTALFGDKPFVDDTGALQGRSPRAFASFGDAAQEAALSRLYGGIHFRGAVERGLAQGRCVGDEVVRMFER